MPQSETYTRALYNGDCPVCSAEMCAYEAYSDKNALPVVFDDLNKVDLTEWGVTEDAATRLLHVLHDGKLHVGFDAFLILWEQMPRYRLLARIGRLPVLFPMLDWIYANVVAKIIYERHQRRKARGLIKAD